MYPANISHSLLNYVNVTKLFFFFFLLLIFGCILIHQIHIYPQNFIANINNRKEYKTD